MAFPNKKAAKTIGAQWFSLDEDVWSNIIYRLDLLDVQNFMSTYYDWSDVSSNLNTKHLTSGIPMLVTSRADSNHSRLNESLGDGSFGMHDVSEGTSFLVHSNYLKDKVWVGGKDDWLVISDNMWSLELVSFVTGETVPLPSFCLYHKFKYDKYTKHEVVCGYTVGNLLRVVLCQTPSVEGGHLAIALFDRDVLAYTSRSSPTWTFLAHHSPHNYFIELYMDAIVHKGRVVAVDTEGFVFSWHMGDQDDNLVLITSAHIPFVEEYFFNCYSRVFYLAKTRADELILMCVQGNGEDFDHPYYRVLKSELDRMEDVEEMYLFKFDDIGQTWRRIQTTELGTSLFVGLNYPFCDKWSGTELNSVYVANMMDYDVVKFSVKGQRDVPIERDNYPVKKGQRLSATQSMRTPMWFRPTRPIIKCEQS